MSDAIEKGREEGREEGLALGEEKGIHKTKLDMAKKLKSQGFPLEQIQDLTGLSLEVLEEG